MRAAEQEQFRGAIALRQATETAVVAAISLTVLMLVAIKVPLSTAGIPTMTAILGSALAAAALFRGRSSGSLAADALSSTALIWLGGLSCGFTSLLGLRGHFPLVDAKLMMADRAFHVNVLAITQFIAVHAPGTLVPLRTIYGLTLPVLFICILAAFLVGERRAAWRATFGFVAGLLVTCLISIFTPAKGSYVMAGPEILALVPSDAGRYFFATFDAFYGSGPVALGLGSLNGVVCFPSFHAIVALLTAAVWKERPLIHALACLWCGLVLISTIPMGGHYVVDLVAGAVVWAIVGRVAAYLEAGGSVRATAIESSPGVEPEPSLLNTAG